MRRTRDRNRPAPCRPARICERRDIHTQLIRSQIGIGVPVEPICDDVAHDPFDRQDAAPERKRARHDPAATIDHLDVELLPAQRRIQRARRAQERGGGRAQLRDLNRPLPQRTIERAAEMAPHEQICPNTDYNQREQDRDRRGDDRAGLQRTRHHRSSTKPTPRTV